MALRDVRVPHANWIALALAIAAFGGWLWVVHDFSFRYDEWNFVLHQPADAGSYFLPHSEHWVTVPILIYQVLLSTIGMRSHLPYMFVLVFLHATTALLLYWIIRQRAGELLALISMAVLLALGWGADEFMWAFQMSWQASCVAGLLAIGLLTSSHWNWLRAAVVALLLVVSVASSGVGLAFMAASAAEVGLTTRNRVRFVALLPPIAAYTAWYLTVGHANAHPIPFSPTAATHVGAYVLYGAGAGAAALSGVGSALGMSLTWTGLVPLLILVVIGCWRRLDARIVGPLVGVVTLLTLAGVVRVERFGVAEAASTRYVYVVAVFLLALGSVAISRWPRTRLTMVPLTALTLVSLLGNIRAASGPAAFYGEVSRTTSIELRILNDIRGNPRLKLGASPDPVVMPQLTAGSFYAAEDRLGSPVLPSDLLSISRSDPGVVTAVLNAVLSH